MNKAEIAELLGFAAAFDQRTVGEDDVEAWHKVIGQLDLEDCQGAVIDHYHESEDPIRPVHILRRVRPTPSEASRLPSALSVDTVLPPGPDARADVAGPAMVREAMRRAHEENVARRDRVLAHRDLAARLCERPLAFDRPEHWTGYVPSDNPERDALLALDAEATRRAKPHG